LNGRTPRQRRAGEIREQQLRWASGIRDFRTRDDGTHIYETLKVSPAVAARVTDRLWEMTDLVEMIEAFETSRERTA
jgi:hypothetical protein